MKLDIGTVFGKLTVTRLGDPALPVKDRFVRVRCECGKEVDKKQKLLVGGNTRSCGCLRVNRARAMQRRMFPQKRKAGRLTFKAYIDD